MRARPTWLAPALAAYLAAIVLANVVNAEGQLPWDTGTKPPQQNAEQQASQPQAGPRSDSTAPGAGGTPISEDKSASGQKSAGASRTCRTGESGRKIWDGVSAPDQETTVGISFRDTDGIPTICTGVVIDDSESGRGTILTAGHCSCGSDYELKFGTTFEQSQSVRATAVRSFKHRTGSYDCRYPELPQPGRDYAIIHFNSRDVRKEISTAKIASPVTVRASAMVPASKMLVVGYGLTETGGSGQKRKAEVPVFSWMCSEKWAYDGRGCRPFAEMLLARWGDTTGRNVDTCNGDSGGPVFAELVTGAQCNDAGQLAVTSEQVLVAITSRAMRLNPDEVTTRCGGGGIYGIVARAPVLDWLRSHGVRPRFISDPPWPTANGASRSGRP